MDRVNPRPQKIHDQHRQQETRVPLSDRIGVSGRMQDIAGLAKVKLGVSKDPQVRISN